MPEETQPERPVNAQEAAEYLGLHYGTVARLAREGKIPAHAVDPTNPNKKWRFFVSELEAHLKSALVCAGKPVPSKKGGK